MKRKNTIILSLLMISFLFSGCAENQSIGTANSQIQQSQVSEVYDIEGNTKEELSKPSEQSSQISQQTSFEESSDEALEVPSEEPSEDSSYYIQEPSKNEYSQIIEEPKEPLTEIENFSIIYQMPELPTGCEITAMTMVLNHYGFDVDKVTMATQYLPTMPANLHYDENGVLFGNDLRCNFIGDPTTELGYVCGAEAIVTAANKYFESIESTMHAINLTGATPGELYQMIDQKIPVVVWVTIAMEERAETKGWYTESGDYVEWSTNDHGAVLIGYNKEYVAIADPIYGRIECKRSDFESVFDSRGNQCVIIQ